MKGWSRNKQAGANIGKPWMSRIAMVSLMGLALMMVIIATATGAGVSMRVSTDSSGVQANSSSSATSISSDGRYIAFSSYASNLVSGDSNGTEDIFLKDTQTGQVTRVSTSSSGAEGNGGSYTPSISADGRYIAFLSHATSLVAGDTNGRWETDGDGGEYWYEIPDVFVKDTLTGQTTRVNTSATGVQANEETEQPVISGDGRYVVFRSRANSLVAGDNTTWDIFRKDTQTGAISRISTDDDIYTTAPFVSADGRYVAFIRSIGDPGNDWDVYIKDMQTGTLSQVSQNDFGTTFGPTICSACSPSISADGRYVVYSSNAAITGYGDTNAVSDIFMKDRQTGATTRVSTDASGAQADGASISGHVSPDGRYVSFHSGATNLVPGDTNGKYDVFVKDTLTGQITLASRDAAGNAANNSSYGYSAIRGLSNNGQYVTFLSYATNLVPGDTNGVSDVFLASTGAAPPADTTAPTVSNIQPTGTVNSSSATVSAYYSDADPSSGIDAASASLTVSGGTVSDCVASAAGITCTVSGLADGEHTINVSVADNEGNTGSGSGSFTVDTCQPAKPALGISNTGAYWDGYADYQARLLTVSYSISNTGPGDAYGIGLVGAVNSMGVTTATGMPSPLGNAATGTSLSAGVKYQVPAGVGSFKSSIYATAADACGESYSYPGPMPER